MKVQMPAMACTPGLRERGETVAKRNGASRSVALRGIAERALLAIKSKERFTFGTRNEDLSNCLLIAAGLALTTYLQSGGVEHPRQGIQQLSKELELRGCPDTSPAEEKAPANVAGAGEDRRC